MHSTHMPTWLTITNSADWAAAMSASDMVVVDEEDLGRKEEDFQPEIEGSPELRMAEAKKEAGRARPSGSSSSGGEGRARGRLREDAVEEAEVHREEPKPATSAFNTLEKGWGARRKATERTVSSELVAPRGGTGREKRR